MIWRSVLFAASLGIACGAAVLALFAYGVGARGGVWALLPAGIAAVVAAYEWMRIRRTPLDADRPGIVPGDE